MKVGGSLSFDQDREAKVEAYKPPMFKGVYNAQDVEALLWHFENYFKYNRVKTYVSNINNAVSYLSEMDIIWWRHEESEIGKGLCIINT